MNRQQAALEAAAKLGPIQPETADAIAKALDFYALRREDRRKADRRICERRSVADVLGETAAKCAARRFDDGAVHSAFGVAL